MSLGLRAAVLAGLAAGFLVIVFNGLSQDVWPDPPSEDRQMSAPTPSPTATQFPTPAPPPSQAQLCVDPNAYPDFAQAVLHGYWGEIIGLVYCEGTDLRYVTYVDMDGQLERTYLFQDGVVRVKLYHSGGNVVKREDFDMEGNLVPDGTYIKLPNSRIGPGSETGLP